MLLASIILFIILILLFILIKSKNFSIKVFMIVLISLTIFTTGYICVKKPTMHNQISLSIIDYLIKFNTDGSMTTTKQTTTQEVIKEDKE